MRTTSLHSEVGRHRVVPGRALSNAIVLFSEMQFKAVNIFASVL